MPLDCVKKTFDHICIKYIFNCCVKINISLKARLLHVIGVIENEVVVCQWNITNDATCPFVQGKKKDDQDLYQLSNSYQMDCAQRFQKLYTTYRWFHKFIVPQEISNASISTRIYIEM